jgi:hypothetical protein
MRCVSAVPCAQPPGGAEGTREGARAAGLQVAGLEVAGLEVAALQIAALQVGACSGGPSSVGPCSRPRCHSRLPPRRERGWPGTGAPSLCVGTCARVRRQTVFECASPAAQHTAKAPPSPTPQPADPMPAGPYTRHLARKFGAPDGQDTLGTHTPPPSLYSAHDRLTPQSGRIAARRNCQLTTSQLTISRLKRPVSTGQLTTRFSRSLHWRRGARAVLPAALASPRSCHASASRAWTLPRAASQRPG